MRLARARDQIGNVADLTVSEAVAALAPIAPSLHWLAALALELANINPGIKLSPTGMTLPDDLTAEQWVEVGKLLSALPVPQQAEQHGRLGGGRTQALPPPSKKDAQLAEGERLLNNVRAAHANLMRVIRERYESLHAFAVEFYSMPAREQEAVFALLAKRKRWYTSSSGKRRRIHWRRVIKHWHSIDERMIAEVQFETSEASGGAPW
jgi:hypothetical protein